VRLALRSRRREQRFPDYAAAEPAVVASDLRLDLFQALGELSPTQRAAVALYYLDDLPVIEVARLLGCADSTVRVHLHRATKRLGVVLGEELDDAR